MGTKQINFSFCFSVTITVYSKMRKFVKESQTKKKKCNDFQIVLPIRFFSSLSLSTTQIMNFSFRKPHVHNARILNNSWKWLCWYDTQNNSLWILCIISYLKLETNKAFSHSNRNYLSFLSDIIIKCKEKIHFQTLPTIFAQQSNRELSNKEKDERKKREKIQM